MSFVAPLFLAGLLAIGLPFWLHRLQTRSSVRKPFSSAMLLETAKERVHVRKKLKYLVLLAMRVALLALVALAFAGPFVTKPPTPLVATEAGTRLILVDTSASMGRTGAFEQALDAARDAIDAAPADAVLQVIGADGTLTLQGSPGPDKGAARAALGSLAVSALRLDFGAAMSGVERIAAGLPPPVTLHIVSDFQAGGMPVRFADLVPGGVAGIETHEVGTGAPFNWSAEFLRQGPDVLQFGLTGAGDRDRIADVQLLLNGTVVETRATTGTGPQVIEFALPELEAGQNRIEVRIESDDDLASDNRWFHVIDNVPPAAVPIVTPDPGGLPVTYLAAALESAGRYAVETLVPGTFDHRVLGRFRWIVIDDLGFIDAELASALSAYVEEGGNILGFAGERANSLEVMPVSGHRHRPATVLAAPGEYRSVGSVDRAHPALVRAEGWQTVHVTRSLALEVTAADEIPIRLDDNAPFLIERRLGAGRMLIMPIHLDNRWSDLPVRPVFVSYVVDAAAYLSGDADIARAYVAGEALPLSAAGNSSGQVVDPDGNRILSLVDTTREQQIRLNKPGFYEVYTRDGETVVAVNLDPRESGLERLASDVLERWREAAAGQAVSSTGTFRVETEQTLELWHWALLLLAVIVIMESIMGNMHFSPRRMERA